MILTDTKKGRVYKRVTTDKSPKFNHIILYEDGDERFKHWDAMYTWEP